jgi:hypothetical protein
VLFGGGAFDIRGKRIQYFIPVYIINPVRLIRNVYGINMYKLRIKKINKAHQTSLSYPKILAMYQTASLHPVSYKMGTLA